MKEERAASFESADQPVVFGVGADPEPDEISVLFDCQGPVLPADSHRPQTVHFFEMQRRVPEIFFQEIEGGVTQITHGYGELIVAGPESGCGAVVHSDEVFPALYSAWASLASRSRRPLQASSSN